MQTIEPPAEGAQRLSSEQIVEAVYEDGVIRPLTPLDLPEGTRLRLALPPTATVILAVAEQPLTEPLARPARLRAWRSTFLNRLSIPASLSLARFNLLLFSAGLLVYIVTRFWQIALFPIYFFCDEAIQTVLAQDLLAHGLRDSAGRLLPPFFLNAEKWNLSLSVYVHLVSLVLFGKSVLVTRGTSAAISILAAVAISLTLRLIFKQRFWWAGGLVLATMPAWFLHSRTAFETVMMVAFFACFLCLYLLYRYRSPHYLYGAIILGAMTFYSYAPGQGLMLMSGVVLLLSDIRYHFRQRRTVLVGIVLVAVLLVPLIRFRREQPTALTDQLQALYSYWLDPIPWQQKVGIFVRTYLRGLDPTYWFVPNGNELERHRMKGMGNIRIEMLPLFVIGLGLALRNWRSSAYRTLLLIILVIPISSALVEIAITRVLVFVVPATLLICFGLEQLAVWLRRWLPYRAAALMTVLVLTLMSGQMTRAALRDGPTWYTDYGMGGMQYGASQLFATIPPLLAASPETRILLSPTWANNPNIFAPYFLDKQQQTRVDWINVDAFMVERRTLDRTMLFVMPPDEYKRAVDSGKFLITEPEHIIPYPDGRPGFYFVRMEYVSYIDDILAADRQARAHLVESTAELDGEPIIIQHSMLDTGQVKDLLDGDPRTLIRGMEANPLRLVLQFAGSQPVTALGMDFGSMEGFRVVVTLTRDGGTTETIDKEFIGLPKDPHIDLALPTGAAVSQIQIEVTDLNQGETAHVHIRGLELR